MSAFVSLTRQDSIVPESSYYVVMDLEDDRIDSKEVTLVEKYDSTEGW